MRTKTNHPGRENSLPVGKRQQGLDRDAVSELVQIVSRMMVEFPENSRMYLRLAEHYREKEQYQLADLIVRMAQAMESKNHNENCTLDETRSEREIRPGVNGS